MNADMYAIRFTVATSHDARFRMGMWDTTYPAGMYAARRQKFAAKRGSCSCCPLLNVHYVSRLGAEVKVWTRAFG